MQTTIERGGLSPAAWSHAVKPAWSYPMLEVLMKSLTPIEETWAGLPDGEAIAQLERREDLLGVATVSCRAFELLYEVITDFGIANMIRRHPPSVTAAAKQALLDSDRQ